MRTGKIENPATINKLWMVAYDSGELVAAVTSLTIPELNGDVDEEYQLIARIVNGYNGSTNYRARPNNDDGSNYGLQSIVGSDVTISASRVTEVGLFLCGCAALSDIGFCDSLIYAKSGQVRTAIIKNVRSISTTTVTSVYLQGQSWNNTADNITSLVIAANQASGIGIGSRIILLKKVKLTTGQKTGTLNIQGSIKGTWQKIYETTLAEAAISVTIPNLDGNTDVLYRLRVRAVNGYNGGSSYYIRPNNDSGSNYGYQYMAGGQAATAGRGVGTSIYAGYTSQLGRIAFSECILHAKSGYVRTAIAKIEDQIETTAILNMELNGDSWNNTADNITSLVISSDQANSLGVGTHIILERLNL